MRSEIRFFINFFIWGILSLIFVFAGKYDSEATYFLGLLIYAHLFWSHFYDVERLEKRLKHVKAAYKCAFEYILYGARVDYSDTDSSANRTDTNTDCED